MASATVTETWVRGDMGQAQRSNRGDGTHSRDETQTQPMSSRLPRMRRCSCCLTWQKGPGEIHRYHVVDVGGCGVYGRLLARPPRDLDPSREIERVTVVPRGLGVTHRYERIRGGRWVDASEAEHGVHEVFG